MFAICSGFEILPARTCAGSPPTQLNRKKMSRMTPAIVGIICQSLRITYAVMRASSASSHGDLLRRQVEIQVFEIGVEDRVLLVSLHPRVLQVIEDAVHAQPPGRVREHQAIHFTVEAIA